MKKIFILTGEPSGDKLASRVINHFKKNNSDVEYLSVGGENLKSLGIQSIYELSEIEKISNLCKKHGLALHLDGARLWNALEVTKDKPSKYGASFDTISLCFSKGLGCPVGSVLVGSKHHINKALRIRKVFGGGMRQAGYLAAAGIFALNNNIDDLKKDHVKAKEIGETLENCSFINSIEPIDIEAGFKAKQQISMNIDLD